MWAGCSGGWWGVLAVLLLLLQRMTAFALMNRQMTKGEAVCGLA
jgi:hypothetical protein